MATFAPQSGPGDMTTFNILHGFAEALVRGMRNSFLADSDYHHLTQCESLEDVKLNLTESDYAEALADMGSISPNELQKQAIEKVRGDTFGSAVISVFVGFCHFEGTIL
jgi:vacuolar-type H+-ATPase subunit C/Vma6